MGRVFAGRIGSVHSPELSAGHPKVGSGEMRFPHPMALETAGPSVHLRPPPNKRK